jgi:NAD(P)-dependent dehydrogenase (short-subunit alcohol dehydrogenase family)
MQGKTVLVTGADGGLAVNVTQAFLDAGATVIGSSRKIKQADFTSPAFTAMPGDISSLAGAKMLVDQGLTRFGKLDVLAHTVGGFAGGQIVADTDDATFQRMLDVNLNCVFHILRAAVPPLRQTGEGRTSRSAAARRSNQERTSEPIAPQKPQWCRSSGLSLRKTKTAG